MAKLTDLPVVGCICTCCKNKKCDCADFPVPERCICAFCVAARLYQGEVIRARVA